MVKALTFTIFCCIINMVKKSNKVIDSFSSGLSKKVNLINKQYSKMVEEKIQPLVDAGKLTLTIPDKPKSKNQKYYSK